MRCRTCTEAGKEIFRVSHRDSQVVERPVDWGYGTDLPPLQFDRLLIRPVVALCLNALNFR